MAGESCIYRINSNGQTESSSGITKIEFDTGVVPDAKGHLQSCSWRMVRDLTWHPNPDRALAYIQDGLLGLMEITIAGFVDSAKTANADVVLYNWQKEPGTVPGSLKFGRWGLRINEMPNIFNLTPSNSSAYIIADIQYNNVVDFRSEASFIIRMYRNGTP